MTRRTISEMSKLLSISMNADKGPRNGKAKISIERPTSIDNVWTEDINSLKSSL